MPKLSSNKSSRLGGRRGADSYGRRSPSREPLPLLLIVCEGESTEPNYFHELKKRVRVSNFRIKVEKGSGGSTLNVVECASQLMQEDEYDEVWCVIDTEILATNKSFDAAVKLAVHSGIKLAISNPAFEYWYVLHIQETSRGFTSVAQLITFLTGILPGYKKSTSYTPHIFDRTDIAIVCAEKLLRSQATSTDPYPHPSTNVFELVRRLHSEKPY